MKKHQQEEGISRQCMDPPDLSSVMGWELLQEITRHMDTAGRSNWRLVNKAARHAVYGSTTALAPCNVDYSTTAALKNSITALLPELVEKCSGLKQLSCNYLPLHSIAGLLQLPLGLEALDISSTDVVDLSFIARCTSLRRLEANNVPGCEGLESRQLAAVFKQLPGLRVLQLHDNSLCVDAARDVAAVLQNLTGLEELDIGWTELDVGYIAPAAAAALLSAVPHLIGLRLLNLRFCHLGGQALLPAILQLTRLQQLYLPGNNLQAAGALILAPAVRKLTQLEDLKLCENSMSDGGISSLAPAIQQLTGLTSLDLSDNGFSAAGAQALAPALRHLTRLQHLNLSDNGFGPEGAALLAPAIQELTGLLRLQLTGLYLGAEGMAALAPALQRLTMLQHLYLVYNELHPEGLQALLPGIQQLVSLRSLDLQLNDLDGECALLFAAGIHQLTGLEGLHFSGYEVGRELQPALAAVIHMSSPGCQVICY